MYQRFLEQLSIHVLRIFLAPHIREIQKHMNVAANRSDDATWLACDTIYKYLLAITDQDRPVE
jgi:hypothetical protein